MDIDTDTYALLLGDCVERMRELLPNSVDAVVTDPPYELGFMGKQWDGTGIAYSVDLWREVLRVLKPGGHLLAFGGTRTYHRMTCAIEDAGFEIRDSLHWMYGTGFPKSKTANSGMPEGQGTALKPGHEPIVLARKPLTGTLEQNIAQWGTGGLRIDACRLAGQSEGPGTTPRSSVDGRRGGMAGDMERVPYDTSKGRWPANVLLDEDAAAELDGQSGDKPASFRKARTGNSSRSNVSYGAGLKDDGQPLGFTDSGGASRFFYVAKPSRKERDQGCESLTPRTGGEATDREDDSAGTQNPRAGAGRTGGARNYHPTVKPIELMRYLVRLVTPVGGTVLDPFLGSGTTGMAARLEGNPFIGIEQGPEYFEIARMRVESAA